MITNHSSYIELDREALANNIRFIRHLINEETVLSAVVKGNAYGHGIEQMVPALQELGVHHFSVFSSYEAKQAHRYTTEKATLMIMGDVSPEDRSWVVKNEIDYFVYNPESVSAFLEEAEKQKKKINIHIELETGMHRHGFEEENWDHLIETLQRHRHKINLKGICTHFAGAESSANFKRIKQQQQVFNQGVEKFKAAGLQPDRLHVSCSAAVIAYPDWNLDMVRVGILQYGLWPSKESQLTYTMKYDEELDLKSVLSWRSHIMEIKHVEPGEYVGYGNSFLAERPMKIASVPVGYGYGFSRNLSNTGRVLVNGRRLPVIGKVNMNMMMIDISEVEVEIGDRVTLIGTDGNQQIHVTYFGDLSNQLNYELLTRLDKSIPRKFVGG